MNEQIQLAGCIIVDDYDRILLLHRAADNDSQWELPGGKVERDELVEVAAVRGLQEELGVEVRLIQSVGSGEFEDNERQYVYNWFQADIISGEPNVMEPDKFDDVDYFELEDLMSLALSANMIILLPKLLSEGVDLQR